MRRILLIFLLLSGYQVLAQQPFRVVFWNVENLFDTQNDSLTRDDDFTPDGAYHWTSKRLKTKIDNLYKTLAALGGENTCDTCHAESGCASMPAAIGLAEVENAYVLRQLCGSTPLRQCGYQFIHYDSPDERGIDCALLYRPDRFLPLTSQRIGIHDGDEMLRTRDLLIVQGIADGCDTLTLIVNHWPSKRGADSGEKHRMLAAQQLRKEMDFILRHHPGTTIIAMGDFNATPDEAPMTKGMGFDGQPQNDLGWTNLAALLPTDTATYKYQGAWSILDQMLIAGSYSILAPGQQIPLCAPTTWSTYGMKVFAAPFLLLEDAKRMDSTPFRTYQGPRYCGGFSDHLPIYLDIWH